MSHVDEGALHAFLDGALEELPGGEASRIRDHLSACPECARRLEDARVLREEVAGILAGADPAFGELPPFEELREQARARGRGGSPWRGRSQRLAWAASVVLALGAGWSLRQATAPGASLERALEGSAAAAAASPPAAPESQAVLEPFESETVEEADAEAPEEGAPRPPARPGPEDAARSLVAASEPPVPTRVAAETERSEEAKARLADLRSEADPRERAGDVPPIFRTDSAGGRAAVPVARPRGFVVTERREVAREAVSRAIQAAVLDPLLMNDARAPTSPDVDDLDRQGETLVVPGLTVVSVSWSDGGAPPGVVRVLQLLQDGDTLELLHVPAGSVPPFADASGGTGLSELRVPRDGGGWLLARAPVDEETLRMLVDRLLAAR